MAVRAPSISRPSFEAPLIADRPTAIIAAFANHRGLHGVIMATVRAASALLSLCGVAEDILQRSLRGFSCGAASVVLLVESAGALSGPCGIRAGGEGE